jgi:hypothetical protein
LTGAYAYGKARALNAARMPERPADFELESFQW